MLSGLVSFSALHAVSMEVRKPRWTQRIAAIKRSGGSSFGWRPKANPVRKRAGIFTKLMFLSPKNIAIAIT